MDTMPTLRRYPSKHNQTRIFRSATSMNNYRLNINGQQQNVRAESDTPLLWILRDVLGLFGTKFGCGMGLCGACTVHLDGSAKRSCLLPVSAVGGQSITTIEGLGSQEPHPLQKAWCEHDVAQCGYCQSGQIMTAAALLKENPSPTDDQISEAMAGNICRCGTYPRIRIAIKDAARKMGGKS